MGPVEILIFFLAQRVRSSKPPNQHVCEGKNSFCHSKNPKVFFYFFETANFESLILIDPDYIFKFDDFKPNPQKCPQYDLK